MVAVVSRELNAIANHNRMSNEINRRKLGGVRGGRRGQSKSAETAGTGASRRLVGCGYRAAGDLNERRRRGSSSAPAAACRERLGNSDWPTRPQYCRPKPSSCKRPRRALFKALIFRRKLERAKGFEPSTPTLARLCSTPELHPLARPAGRKPRLYGRSAERLQQGNEALCNAPDDDANARRHTDASPDMYGAGGRRGGARGVGSSIVWA